MRVRWGWGVPFKEKNKQEKPKFLPTSPLFFVHTRRFKRNLRPEEAEAIDISNEVLLEISKK